MNGCRLISEGMRRTMNLILLMFSSISIVAAVKLYVKILKRKEHENP